jgi:multiple sugar transport system permease protein
MASTSPTTRDPNPTTPETGVTEPGGRSTRRSDRTTARGPGSSRPGRRIWSTTALFLGALVFLFPFYYMIVGSLQKKPDTSLKGAFPTGGLTLHNYAEINSRVDLVRSLLNSGIFTGGVLLGTVLFGVLAGYALARLHFRGRGTLFAVMLLVQIVPFQLLIIPIYVMIVRTYGLADSYVGMIAPFAINSTAVFVFRQFFLALPDDLFSAAALDGAGELRILWSVALPLVRPALLTVVLLTFIGPWNEFLWPFLVTKDASLQPLAVTLANYISNIAGRASNPFGAILAGAVVLAAPAVLLFLVFQKRFTASEISSGVKG